MIRKSMSPTLKNHTLNQFVWRKDPDFDDLFVYSHPTIKNSFMSKKQLTFIDRKNAAAREIGIGRRRLRGQLHCNGNDREL